MLSPFEVTAGADRGYGALNSNSITRFNVELERMPVSADIINEALDSNPDQQRYILIRRETSFVLVPADEKIDPTLVPRVAVEDLERRGSTEVVSLVISLTTAVAEDIAPELKKLMGKYGDVVPLGRANQLVLQDTAGNLKRLLRIVKEMEERDA